MRFSKAFFLILFYLSAFCPNYAQSAAHEKILQATEQRNYALAVNELEKLYKSDAKNFQLNNYDYLLARTAEKSGDTSAAMAHYQAVAARNSILKEYALWHLSQLARATGNLLLERVYLQELLTFSPAGLVSPAARHRLTRSYFESKNYDSAIELLNNQAAQAAASKAALKQIPAASLPLNRENESLLAHAFLQTGNAAQARDAFTKLVSSLPNPAQPDDFALEAARALDRLETGAEDFGKRAPRLSDYEHLRRASIYTFNRDYADARIHYLAIIENHPASGIMPDAIYQIGRGYAQAGEFVEAINWYERVQEQFPEHPIVKDALAQTASAYARLNKPREAVTRYQKYIEKYPDAENPERSFLNIVDTLRDAGETTDALKWTAKTREVFRGKIPEALALFAEARIRIAQSDWQNAFNDLEKLQTLSDLGGARVPGGTNQAEATFLKAFALEQMRKYPEAIDVYLSIPDGRNEYYGWRATERLRALAGDEKTKQFAAQKFDSLNETAKQTISANNAEMIRKAAQAAIRLLSDAQNADEAISANTARKEELLRVLRQTYSLLPDYQKVPSFKFLELGRKEVLKEKREYSSANQHQNLADELLFLGLYDEAAPELEKAETEKGKPLHAADVKTNPKSEIPNAKSADFAYTLAVFYQRGEMAHRAVGFAEPLWRAVPADYQIELMPREQAALLYPTPYVESLVKYAPPRQIDPRFALSIMRQESRFRADVKSYAAARGLMQFISTTADRIAGELERKNFRQDELYNPPTAILFGSQYLADLFKQFPNQPAAVAASYNGGETNVARWMARAKSEAPDRYVPEIIFTQSKDYVYKVMANYRVYRTLYDESLKQK